MSAKVNLVGHPENLKIEGHSVTFTMVLGPANENPPKGMPLFKPVTYRVLCSLRQYNRGRYDENDQSDLIIEGYQRPDIDKDGRLFIAVVPTSLSSIQIQDERKLVQIREAFVKAEEEYEKACAEFGENSPEAEPLLAAWENQKANLLKFLDKRPELRKKVF